MIYLTEKERETMLVLLKGFTSYYNANSLSKIIGITHVGTQKILKRLLKESLLISKRIGKSIVYKVNLGDDYVTKLVVFLLADEANQLKRWRGEFKNLFKGERIVMIYGSSIKDYSKSKDIDIMIVVNKKEVDEVNKYLADKQKILPKKLHAIKLTKEDLLENIKKKEIAMIDIIQNAVILYGQEIYLEVLKNVTML